MLSRHTMPSFLDRLYPFPVSLYHYF